MTAETERVFFSPAATSALMEVTRGRAISGIGIAKKRKKKKDMDPGVVPDSRVTNDGTVILDGQFYYFSQH